MRRWRCIAEAIAAVKRGDAGEAFGQPSARGEGRILPRADHLVLLRPSAHTRAIKMSWQTGEQGEAP